MNLLDIIDLIEISIEKENAIKNKSPDKLPLNPTAQGWSGAAVRKAMAEAITGKESVLSELKSKMLLVKEAFQVLVEEQKLEFRVNEEADLEYKLLEETGWTKIINLVEVMGNIVVVGTEAPNNPKDNTIWFDTN